MSMTNGYDPRRVVNRVCPISNGLTTVAVRRADEQLPRNDNGWNTHAGQILNCWVGELVCIKFDIGCQLWS